MGSQPGGWEPVIRIKHLLLITEDKGDNEDNQCPMPNAQCPMPNAPIELCNLAPFI
ncbi:hypothetical protein [Nostoc sp.]